jgi:hypothetical protein
MYDQIAAVDRAVEAYRTLADLTDAYLPSIQALADSGHVRPHVKTLSIPPRGIQAAR